MPAPDRQFLLPALRSRNYRLFFAGQGIFLIGTWMTQIAPVWLVYHLTNSALMLGVVGFTSQIPSFLLTPFDGVFVDDDKRGRVMSLYTMSFLGIIPFASLLGGTLADLIGATDTLIIAGFACILGSLFFSR